MTKLRLMPLMGGQTRPFVRDMVNLAWSPDGTRIVYHTADPGDPMFIADKTGANPRQILAAEPGVHHHYPAWSPDGNGSISPAVTSMEMISGVFRRRVERHSV